MQLINRNLSSKIEFTKPFELSSDSISRINEDCLYLNIYAPIDEFNLVRKKPILIIIHGGDMTGASSLDIQDPSIFSSITDTIVVTFNYRLGIFGFIHINGNEGNYKLNINL